MTICAHDRNAIFGEIVEGKMCLNSHGRIAGQGWQWLSSRYSYLRLDEWVLMPNHLHGIVIIDDLGDRPGRGGSRTAPTSRMKRKPLGRLVGAFKTVTTKRINAKRGTPGARIWQRNYYEHVIRSEEELRAVRHYIRYNPAKWPEDRYNQKNVPRDAPG